jgi:hypothetical protein
MDAETALASKILYLREFWIAHNTITARYSHTHDQLLQFKNAVIELTHGKLSQDLVQPREIQKLLDQINGDLFENATSGAVLKYTTAAEVYRHAKFVYVRHGTHLVVVIRIPLIQADFEHPFQIFKIHKLPIPIANELTHVSTINLQANYVALHKSGREGFYFLSSDELRCDRDGTFEMDRMHAAGHPLSARTCVSALLEDRPDKIAKYCEYNVQLDGIQSDMLIYNDTAVLLINVRNYTAVCQTATGEQLISHHEGCRGVCLVPSFCECSLIAENLKLPGRVTQKCKPREQRISYSANAIIIHKFFGVNDQTNKVLTSLWHAHEVDVQLPSLKVYAENITAFNQQERDLRISMDKIISAMKENKTIHADLESKLLSLGLLTDSSTDWSIFNIDGINWVAIISVTLSTIAIAMAIILSIRLRAVLAAVAIISNARLTSADILNHEKLTFLFNAVEPKSDAAITLEEVIQTNTTINMLFDMKLVASSSPVIVISIVMVGLFVMVAMIRKKIK